MTHEQWWELGMQETGSRLHWNLFRSGNFTSIQLHPSPDRTEWFLIGSFHSDNMLQAGTLAKFSFNERERAEAVLMTLTLANPA